MVKSQIFKTKTKEQAKSSFLEVSLLFRLSLDLLLKPHETHILIISMGK